MPYTWQKKTDDGYLRGEWRSAPLRIWPGIVIFGLMAMLLAVALWRTVQTSDIAGMLVCGAFLLACLALCVWNVDLLYGKRVIAFDQTKVTVEEHGLFRKRCWSELLANYHELLWLQLGRRNERVLLLTHPKPQRTLPLLVIKANDDRTEHARPFEAQLGRKALNVDRALEQTRTAA